MLLARALGLGSTLTTRHLQFEEETEAALGLLRAEGDPASLSEDERDIVVYMRQLMRTNRVEQAVFDALRAAAFADDRLPNDYRRMIEGIQFASRRDNRLSTVSPSKS